jgi:hypothetical protein
MMVVRMIMMTMMWLVAYSINHTNSTVNIDSNRTVVVSGSSSRTSHESDGDHDDNHHRQALVVTTASLTADWDCDSDRGRQLADSYHEIGQLIDSYYNAWM